MSGNAWIRSKDQAEKGARRLCLEGCEKAVHADATLLAGAMRLTNGIVPRRSLVRKYLALWLSSDDNECFGLHGLPPLMSRFIPPSA
jgi:hypothetical protein